MNRVPCRNVDQHQTMPVPELLKNGVQKGSDGKYHASSSLPKKVRAIAFAPMNFGGLAIFLTVLAVGLCVWRLVDPPTWAKAPLSLIVEEVAVYGHWVALVCLLVSVILWRFWRPSYIQTIKERKQGIYCYGCDEFFFEEERN